MRYFLDTEFNGFKGELLSIALAAEDGREIYIQLPRSPNDLLDPWVAKNVMPFMAGTKDVMLKPSKPVQHKTATMLLGMFLASDPNPLIIADWPEDLAHFSSLLILEPGKMFPLPQVQMIYMDMPEFDSAVMSEVPHNALADARALRAFVMSFDEPTSIEVEAPLVELED